MSTASSRGDVCFVHDDELSCSASLSSSPLSSASSGIPPPWKSKRSSDDLLLPSVVRTNQSSTMANINSIMPTHEEIYNDSDNDSNDDDDDEIQDDDDDDTTTAEKHFHCYLLRSLDPKHPFKTYIGFTTHPQRRIRQHNGLLKSGGARRTKKSGRPWTFVCIIHGLQDKITALQLEWAWQHVHKSKVFRAAINNDVMLANKMKRRNGPVARLDELRILLLDCLPYSLFSLTVYFPEQKYYDIFNGILKRGKDGNPYNKDYNYNDHNMSHHGEQESLSSSSSSSSSLMTIEICSLENMPFAKELLLLKQRKKAKQEGAKIQKLEQKQLNRRGGGGGGVMTKTTMKKTTTDYESDISDWLKNAKLIAEDDGSWSDLLGIDDDDDGDNDGTNLNTIKENNDLFVDMCDDDSSSSSSSSESSIFSSIESLCLLSLVDDNDDGCDLATNVMKKTPARYEKENHELKNSTPTGDKLRSNSTRSNCDIVDLCSP